MTTILTFDLHEPDWTGQVAAPYATEPHKKLRRGLEPRGFRWVERSTYLSTMSEQGAVDALTAMVNEHPWLGNPGHRMHLIVGDRKDLRSVLKLAPESR